MNRSLVDSVWSFMADGEFYSPEDLANSSGQPIDLVGRVLQFLARYGFAETVLKRQPLFRKSADAVNPDDSLNLLQKMVARQQSTQE